MQKHRTTILMAVLLSLVGFYIYQSLETPTEVRTVSGQDQPLDGENEIRNVSITSRPGFSPFVEIDYRFRGDFRPGVLRAYALPTLDSPAPENMFFNTRVKVGENSARIRLWRDTSNYIAHATRFVRVEIFDVSNKRVAVTKDLEYPIDWPRLPYNARGIPETDRDVGTLYRQAVAEINYATPASLKNARAKLEAIVSKDPRFVPVYAELARYYMATNWGTEGRRQAERMLNNALTIDPNHANSYVLLGYVYAHEGRHQEAEEAFTKASQIGTDNLWLWANWGQLRLMQGRLAESIAMYNKAIAGERPYNTYDRARKEVYRRLIDIYTLGKDVESTDELHRKRISEYGNEPCYPYHYAKFRQGHFDDDDVVLEYAKKALDSGCEYKSAVRKVIGGAYYSKWNAATKPEDAQSYLAQAQSFFPEGPELIHWLAQSDRTAGVIKRLIKDGVSVDVADNHGFTALAYAVKQDDPEAVKRLIAMGANPNATVGRDKMPLLAVAVMGENKELVGYLVAHGADANAQLYDGVSLLDLANGMGYSDIAELLRNAGGKRI